MVLQCVNGVFSTGNTYIDKLISEHDVNVIDCERSTVHLDEDQKIILFHDHCILSAFIYGSMVISYEWDEEETEFCVNIFNTELSD